MLKTINILIYIFILTTTYLSASVYDYMQSANIQGENIKLENPFMDGHFDEIIRFDKIVLDSDSNLLDNEGEEILKTLVEKVTNYTKESKEIKLTLIGHSAFDTTDETENLLASNNNALSIQSLLEAKGIDKSILILDHRGSKDKLYSGDSSQSRALENRVMITMYVKLPRDLDGDGIDRDQDKCPNTTKGLKVSEDGCKVSTLVVLLKGNKKNTSLIVKTQKGSVTIDKPNQFISIKSKDYKPSQAQSLNEEELATILGDTLKNATAEQISFTLFFEGIKLLNLDKVEKMLEAISQRTTPYIKIIGHTDTVGSMQDNKQVGLNRAEVLKKAIIGSGLEYIKIDTESYSETNLAIKTPDNTFEPLNRRVEVFIH